MRAIQHLMMLADQVSILTADNTELRKTCGQYQKSNAELSDMLIEKQADIMSLQATITILRNELRNLRRCHLN